MKCRLLLLTNGACECSQFWLSVARSVHESDINPITGYDIRWLNRCQPTTVKQIAGINFISNCSATENGSSNLMLNGELRCEREWERERKKRIWFRKQRIRAVTHSDGKKFRQQIYDNRRVDRWLSPLEWNFGCVMQIPGHTVSMSTVKHGTIRYQKKKKKIF